MKTQHSQKKLYIFFIDKLILKFIWKHKESFKVHLYHFLKFQIQMIVLKKKSKMETHSPYM